MERKDIPIPSTGKNSRKKKQQNKNAKKYPQGYFKDKPCKMCSNTFTPYAPSEHYCTDTCKEEGLADAWLYRLYHISLEDYRDMYTNQKGRCKICNSTGDFRASAQHTTSLVIDHDHKTGKVRGLLCHSCNSALGQFQDSPEVLWNAINYLNNEDLVFTKTDRDRVQRTRKQLELSKDAVLNILTDIRDTSLTRAEIRSKYGITESVYDSIKALKTEYAKKAHKRYLKLKESATTIPEGSTSEANADGSGSPLTGNAEGDDIVSSI